MNVTEKEINKLKKNQIAEVFISGNINIME